jgi:hypothetical protein
MTITIEEVVKIHRNHFRFRNAGTRGAIAENSACRSTVFK